MPRQLLSPSTSWRAVLLATALVAPRFAHAQENQAPPPAPTASAPAAAAPSDGEMLDLVAPAPTPAVTDPNDNPYIPVHAVRRSGFVLGLNLGLALTSASGTRVKFSLRDQVADPGLALGYANGAWLGGAFTDWFTFRIGFTQSKATKSGLTAAGTGIYFGVDTWPLFYRGGVFQDLGLGLDFGTGSASIVNKDDANDVRASGGGFSAARFSVFYEPTLVWKIHGGPVISYEYRTTDTYTEHLTVLGARIAFYGGP